VDKLVFQGRKSGKIQVSKHTLAESSAYGNASIIAVLNHLYSSKYPGDKITFDDTERYILGDVRSRFENELLLCLDAEIRNPQQFQNIFNLSWEARLSARPGLRDPTILLDEEIKSLSEVYNKFHHIWFDEDEAEECYKKGTLPSRFITMQYTQERFIYFQNDEVWTKMISRTKDGRLVEELKSLVPYSFIKRFQLDTNTIYREVKNDRFEYNNYTKSSGNSQANLWG
jgi:hypothetical protein